MAQVVKRTLVPVTDISVPCRRFGDSEGGKLSEVKQLFAEQAESPLNFHQVTNRFCVDGTISIRAKVAYFSCSALIIFGQVASFMAILFSIGVPTCSELRESCPDGKYCRITDNAHDVGRCAECIVIRSLRAYQDAKNPKDAAAAICGGNRTGVLQLVGSVDEAAMLCAACVSTTGKFKIAAAVAGQGALMISGLTWVALVLVLIIATFMLTSEIRDIRLCSLVRTENDPIDLPETRCWHRGLDFLDYVREYVVVTLAVMILPFMVSGLQMCQLI
jgi:hypothetical protein